LSRVDNLEKLDFLEPLNPAITKYFITEHLVKNCSIIIVDDHKIFCEGLKGVLESESIFKV